MGALLRFIGRHRRKFIVLLVLVGCGSGLYLYIRRMLRAGLQKVEQLGKQLEVNMLKQKQRQGELMRLKSETNELVSTFTAPLNRLVKDSTDPKPVTEALKEVRQKGSATDKMVELWESLKVISLARLLVLLYGICYLNALLQVQLYVVARESFDGTSEISTSNREQALLFITSKFLAENKGVESLVKALSKIVKHGTPDWNMGTDQTITVDGIIEKFNEFRHAFEHDRHAFNWFKQKCLPEADSSTPEYCQETLDILESPLSERLLVASFDAVFDTFFRQMHQKRFSFLENSLETGEFMLTRVIVAFLKEVSPEVVRSHENSFLTRLYSLSSLDSLCAEIFSVGNEETSLGDNLGMDLSSFGLSEDDIKSFQGLLSGDEGELIKLLQSLGSQDGDQPQITAV